MAGAELGVITQNIGRELYFSFADQRAHFQGGDLCITTGIGTKLCCGPAEELSALLHRLILPAQECLVGTCDCGVDLIRG